MKKEDLQNMLKEAEDQLKQLDARKLAKEVLIHYNILNPSRPEIPFYRKNCS